jgi:hypothetical protein
MPAGTREQTEAAAERDVGRFVATLERVPISIDGPSTAAEDLGASGCTF